LGLFVAAGAKVLGAASDNACGSIASQIRASVSSMVISEDLWLFQRNHRSASISPTILNFPVIKPNRSSPSSAPAQAWR
jgi:hypothetical protein